MTINMPFGYGDKTLIIKNVFQLKIQLSEYIDGIFKDKLHKGKTGRFADRKQQSRAYVRHTEACMY